VIWAKKKNILDKLKVQAFLRDAEIRPIEARQALQQAITFREILYRILVSVVRKEKPLEVDLAELNHQLKTYTCGASIVETTDGFDWKWNINEETVDPILWPITLSIIKLLTSEDRKRLGQCADEQGCGWIFLDQSKNHSRRWCDIRDCGNRAKQRRHYQKERER
jgi:predicted RNA-binding Zn ribbon-like protein